MPASVASVAAIMGQSPKAKTVRRIPLVNADAKLGMVTEGRWGAVSFFLCRLVRALIKWAIQRKDVIYKISGAQQAIRAIGALHIYLFGSVARNEATDSSDVDVFIDRDPSMKFGLLELSRLRRLLENTLGGPVDVGTRGGLHTLIKADVERTAVRIF